MLGPMLHHLAALVLVPFAAPSAGRAVVGPDSTVTYAWSTVTTPYLLTAPLNDIAAAMRREAMGVDISLDQARHDLPGGCRTPGFVCVCLNGAYGPAPIDGMLTTAQWCVLFDRIASDAERTGDASHLCAMIDLLVAVRHKPDAPHALPDLTPLAIALVDAAARGDAGVLAEASSLRALSDRLPDLYDQDRVRTHLAEAVSAARDEPARHAITQMRLALGVPGIAAVFDACAGLPRP